MENIEAALKSRIAETLDAKAWFDLKIESLSEDIGPMLREYRRTNGRMTQKKLALLLDRTPSLIAHIERGKKPPTPDFLDRLLELLNGH